MKNERIKREVVHVESPVLYEDMFPYTDIPKTFFDSNILESFEGKIEVFSGTEMEKRDIFITDTTFRDGQQARPPYTIEQIEQLFKYMHKLGGHNGVIRQTEFFVYTPKDREAVDKVRSLGYKYPEITGWIRAEKGDLRIIKEMGFAESGILTSCSDYHIFYKLKGNRARIFDNYMGVVKEALSAGIRPRCHLEDVTRADIFGFVVPFVQELMRVSEEVGENLKAKIRLCDTMGFGVPFVGVSLPRSVPKLVRVMIEEGGVPSHRLEWHGHNDFHKAHVNAVTAWLYGCDALNATLFGIGERTGNPPLEAAVMEYVQLKKHLHGINVKTITEIYDYYKKEIAPIVPFNYPFVGEEFNLTRAGIHADGLFKDDRIYNIFDTEKVLGRKPKIGINDKSSIDGVLVWVNDFLGLKGDERVTKKDVAKIARWVKDQYEVQNRITTISHEEMEALVKEHLPEHYYRRQG